MFLLLSHVLHLFFKLKKDIKQWKVRIHLWDSESLFNIQIVPDWTPRFLELTAEGLESMNYGHSLPVLSIMTWRKWC